MTERERSADAIDTYSEQPAESKTYDDKDAHSANVYDVETGQVSRLASDPAAAEAERLNRQLKSRHASMLALGGAIGTGLILNSGTGLNRGGPVGLLIAFIYVGTLCFSMMCALGEMSAFLPHQRGFPGHGTRFVSGAWGGMAFFTYYLKYLLATPTSWTAMSTIINYWVPSSTVNNGVWIALAFCIASSIQFLPVRFFGEFEFYLSTFKVLTLAGLMLMMLIVDVGGGPNHVVVGFSTWRDLPFGTYLQDGPMGHFLGFVSSLITAVYSYTGTEMIGIALGEMNNPSKNVTRSIRACFYRIVILYCGSVFFIGLVVPADSPLLISATKSSGTAAASPFVVAANVAGIKVLPHIINACAIFFVVSGANSDIYVNSRTMYSMALEGHIPKVFGTLNRFGVPYVALMISLSFACLAFTTVSSSSYTTFQYFVSGVTLFATVAWCCILFAHIRMMKAMKAQGISRDILPYRSRFQPFMSWWGLIGTIIISLTKGFDTIVGGFNAKNFVIAYVALPAMFLSFLWFGYRTKSWLISPEKVDLATGTRRRQDLEETEPEAPREKGILGFCKHFWLD